ncbi:Protein shisa-like-2A [Dissostichus eleginoides]|uniref:Protein shisa-like-2A n=1 Tax=Dissostichus eleginoides TaxID=100907 RepID=A0AAD9B913_DISEL|nr:Protein shisa-like-2A [Dissostichus eleginoides]
MSAECSSYSSADGAFVDGFSCPRAGNAAVAVYCCGFNDVKYCCDDPNSFFPYEYGYMWWLSEGPSRGRAACISGPQGFRKHFMSRKLDCDNQPPDPELLFQRCFTATVVGIKVENPS